MRSVRRVTSDGNEINSELNTMRKRMNDKIREIAIELQEERCRESKEGKVILV